MKRFIYNVHGQWFNNKKQATDYHKKIYGNANFQASIIYDRLKNRTYSLNKNLKNIV